MANIEQAIKLPFSIGITGSVETTSDQSKIWQDRVLSVVGTAIGERVQRYYFGSKVHLELFDTATAAAERLPSIINKAFMDYLPLLTLKDVITEFDSDNGVLEATVLFALPSNEISQVKVGTIQIDGNLPFKEL